MGSNKSTRFLYFLLIPLALPALFSPAVNAAPLGTIIYQDGFTVDGVERQYNGNLNQTTVEGALLKWIAPSGMIFSSVNGEDVVSSTVQNSNGAVINSDLSLVGGTVKIEIDAMPLGTGSADPDRANWIAIGFQPEATPAWVINAGGISMIFRGNGGYQIFANGAEIPGSNATPVVGYTQGAVADMSIAYDSATNTATFVINGQVVYTSGNLGAFADKAKRPFVTTYDAGMWFDNFTVSMEGGVLPVMIVPQSPANGAVQVDVDTSLSWAPVFPVVQELKFDVYLDPNEALVTNLDPSTRVSSKYAGFSYTPAAPLAYETVYYWRILPYIDGEPNQPSEVRNFFTQYEVQKWSHAPWVSDADLDISPGKIYTHKVKLNANSEAWNTRVMGVLFENTTDRSGANWSMTGASNPYDAASAFAGTGEGRALTNRFFYGNPSALTLTGLTPGMEYCTTFYTHSWGDPGQRVVQVTASDDGKVNQLDENMDGGNNGRLFMYTYTAPASGEMTFQFNAVNPANSWHHYAFSNEVLTDIYLHPSPLPDSAVADNVDLSWQLNGTVADPSYHLYVATDAGMTNLLVDADLSDSTYPLVLTPNTNYYWKVVVKDGGVVVHTSPVWDFTTKWSGSSWMTDADLDISAGKIYTHKVKFNGISEAFTTKVKGVQFEDDTTRSGADWSLTGAGSAHPGTQFSGSGEGAVLETRFYYGHPSALTLNGLTPGVQYRATLYTHGWGDAGGRVVRIASSDDGRGTVLDENFGGNGVGHVFMYTYTAPESGTLTLQFNACMDASWHHYAFSNEIVPDIYLDPTPVPGSAVQVASDLSWQLHGEVANPSYKLYVATDAAMQNLVVQQSVAGTTYHINLSPETSYYWKVEVLDGGVLVHTSPVWNFTTLVPPDAAKVLEWKMDESSGPIAHQTGTSEDADGALMGFNDPNASSMFVTGLVGNAILLNGTTEYVDVSVANPYMPTGNEQAFAVSAYFRTFKPFGPIFSMRNSANGTPLIDITIGHDGAYEAAGKLRMLARDDKDNLGPARDSGILVNDGRWHSMVIMRASGNWIMYVDGIERSRMSGVASGPVTLDWLTIGAEKMWIFDSYGSWNGSRTDIRYFEGMLDEVCIWAGEMRPHQIAALAAVVPPQGDIDFDLDTDPADLKILAENWLMDSYTPVQPSPVILEDMESYSTSDPNSFKDHWEALNGGVSLENVYGNVATAPTSATVGSSVNSIMEDDLYGKVLKWEYNVPADKANAIQRFWLRDRRIDLAAYSHISIRVKKLAGSTGDRFYFDFHDGRGMTNPEQGIFPWVLAWQGRIIMGLADLPQDQWVTLEADIPSGFNGGGRPKQIHDFYEVTIGINSAGVARAGTILIDEIVLSDSTTDCFATVGELLPDMTGDCRVNIEDFALMAANWLKGM